jgi:hypothetical protein
MFRYASGLPIATPNAQNQYNTLTFQQTRFNRVEGQSLYLKDLNSDFDPNADFVLNPAAWANPAAGQLGTGLPYYDDYRYQRRPEEQLSLGRGFRAGPKGRIDVRAEFFNVFNRVSLQNPDRVNPLQTQTRNAQGVPTSGFGRIDTGALYGPPRNGQVVVRYSF